MRAGWKQFAITLCVLATLAPCAHAQTATAAERAAHLKRGINLSMWWAQAGDYSAARLDTFTTADDFKLIKSLGFDHVRLSVNPEPLTDDPTSGALKPEPIARLAKTVAAINAAGLVVVLDVHPESSYKAKLLQAEDGPRQVEEFWRNFARAFASTDPALVYFELMNEPEVQDGYRWAGLQARLVGVVRSEAPQHTIIATGAAWSAVDKLVDMEPVADDNVIYTFHFYEPYWFTHQSASWAGAQYLFVHNVPYPPTAESVAKILDEEPDPAARYHFRIYAIEGWGPPRMDAVMLTAQEWGDKHHVPVWLGEFGVYLKAPAADRQRWITDVRTAAEAHNIGWCMWDYQGGFGLVSKDGGKTTLDQGVVTALGLKPQ